MRGLDIKFDKEQNNLVWMGVCSSQKEKREKKTDDINLEFEEKMKKALEDKKSFIDLSQDRKDQKQSQKVIDQQKPNISHQKPSDSEDDQESPENHHKHHHHHHHHPRKSNHEQTPLIQESPDTKAKKQAHGKSEPTENLEKSSEESEDEAAKKDPRYQGIYPKKDKDRFKPLQYDCEIKKIQINREKIRGVDFYKLIFTVHLTQKEFVVEIDGILSNRMTKEFIELHPTDYIQATQNSTIPCFFTKCKYFNAVKPFVDNSVPFKYQMYIERNNCAQFMKQIRSPFSVKPDEKGKLKQGLNPQLSSTNYQMLNSVNKSSVDMMEMILIYDLIYQENFKNLLVAKIIQDNYPQFKDEFIQIDYLLFIFEEEPLLDIPQFCHLSVFYKRVAYSINTLHNFCIHENYTLNEDFLIEMAKNLTNILTKAYKAGFYRLNITMDTIYYSNEDKVFRLKPFNTLQPLAPIGGEVNLASIKSTTNYVKAFNKDRMAIFDILLIFLRLRNLKLQYRQIRKQTIDQKLVMIESNKYKYPALQRFLQVFDREISTYEGVQKMISDFRPFMRDLEMIEIQKHPQEFTLTKTERIQREQEALARQQLGDSEDEEESESQDDDNSDVDQSGSLNSQNDQSKDGEQSEQSKLEEKIEKKEAQNKMMEILPTLHLLFDSIYNQNDIPYGSNPEILDQDERTYQKIYIESILQRSFGAQLFKHINELKEVYQQKLETNPRDVVIASRLVIIMEIKLTVQEQVEKKINPEDLESHTHNLKKIMMKLHHDIQDPIFYVALLRTIYHFQKVGEWDYLKSMLQKYKRSIQHQNKLKQSLDGKGTKKKAKKLRGNDSANGPIQVRKSIIYGIYLTKMFLNTSQFAEASQQIQQLTKLSTDYKMDKSVLHGYVTYMQGLINKQSLALGTAVLNFDIAKGLYWMFFTSQHLNISYIDSSLGNVYLDKRDFDNAMKCYQNAYEVRIHYFSPLTDQMLEIAINLLHIYVEQEETGLAIKLSQTYMKIFDIPQNSNWQGSNILWKFQLILGSIFLSLGSYISAIICFKRASRSMIENGNIFTSLFIQNKIVDCLYRIHYRSLVAIGWIGETRTSLYSQEGFTSMAEMALASFQTFSHQSKQTKINKKSSRICIKLALAKQYAKNNADSEQALKYFEQCLNVLQQKKIKDEKYGIVLINIGQIYLLKKMYVEAQSIIMKSLGFFERYMEFPQQQIYTITAKSYLIICNVFTEKKQVYQKLLVEIANYISDFNKSIKLSQKANSSKHSKLVIPHKFDMMVRVVGMKLGYQMVDLLELIQKFSEFRQQITKAMLDEQPVDQITQKYYEHLLKQDQFQKDIQQNRITLMSGTTVKLTLAPAPVKYSKTGEIIKDIDEDDEYLPKKSMKRSINNMDASMSKSFTKTPPTLNKSQNNTKQKSTVSAPLQQSQKNLKKTITLTPSTQKNQSSKPPKPK